MVQTKTARIAQSRLAAAIRDYGADSDAAIEARRIYRTARIASQIIEAQKEPPGWSPAERAALIDAIDGKEVSPDPYSPSAPWQSDAEAVLDEGKRSVAAHHDWANGMQYSKIAKKHNYPDAYAARAAVQAAGRGLTKEGA